MSIIDHISLTSIKLSDSSSVVRLNKNIVAEIKCEICQREFKYNNAFKRHIKSHQNNKIVKKYSCKRCSKRFVINGFLERHVQIYNRNREHVKKLKAIKSIINQNCGDNEPGIDNTLYPYKRLFDDINYSNEFCLINNKIIDDYSNHILNTNFNKCYKQC